MMEAISLKEWEAFFIKDIVALEKTRQKLQVPTGSNVSKSLLKKGKIPRITVTSYNNGVDGFYQELLGHTREYKNFISVSFLGDAFYHPYKATTDMKVHTFQLNDRPLNRYIALFIITALKNNTKSFSYGDQLSSTDLPLKKVLLPIDSRGNPDYDFMEEYVKEQERKVKDRYRACVRSTLNGLCKEIKQNEKWRAFSISEIFSTIQRGKRLVKERQKPGKIPYISSTALNNGVDNFIGNDVGVRKYNNCLSLANSGSVGSCFYEPFTFVASDHVTHLKGEYSKYQYLFMACMLNRLTEKYNFNREINDPRIQKEKIFLPVNSKGEPDYKYMEDYMKYLEQQKILSYLDYLDQA